MNKVTWYGDGDKPKHPFEKQNEGSGLGANELTADDLLKIDGKIEKAKTSAIEKSARLNSETNLKVSSLQESVERKEKEASDKIQNLTDYVKKITGVDVLADSEYVNLSVWGNNWCTVTETKTANEIIRRVNLKGDFEKSQVGFSNSVNSSFSIVEGRKYVLTFQARASQGIIRSGFNYMFIIRNSKEGPNQSLQRFFIQNTDNFEQVEVSFVAPWSSSNVRLLIAANGNFSKSDFFEVKNVKLSLYEEKKEVEGITFAEFQTGHIPASEILKQNNIENFTNAKLVRVSWPEPFSKTPVAFVQIRVEHATPFLHYVQNITNTGFEITSNYASAITGVDFIAFVK